jgi:hypothetical protein
MGKKIYRLNMREQGSFILEEENPRFFEKLVRKVYNNAMGSGGGHK